MHTRTRPAPAARPDARGIISASSAAARRRKPPIVFIINCLTLGGAERAMSTVLVGLKPYLEGHDVHLVMLDREVGPYPIPDYVITHQLDARRGLLRGFRQLLRTLRQIRPGIAVSFLERSNVLNVACSALLGYPSVISERIHTTSHLGGGPGGWMKRALVRLTYPRAGHVIAVSAGVRDDLTQNFGVPGNRTSVIGNPVNVDHIVAQSEMPPPIVLPPDYVVAVGRLVPAKNFAMLIEAFAQVPERHLVILGEGEERPNLERLAKRLGIDHRVHMPGFLKNPYPVVARASCYVAASNAEGFPNALIEAMCVGRPVVATDCPTGPSEILTGKDDRTAPDNIEREFGMLVPMNAVGELVRALTRMDDPAVREFYGNKAGERARTLQRAASGELYLQIIREVLDSAGDGQAARH